jgi:hypothetical protein
VRGTLETLLHHRPYEFGIQRMRWRLQDLRQVCAWLKDCSLPGVYQVLKRLGFSRKQALGFICSPDPAYALKWRAVLQAFAQAVNHPDRVVFLFLDELTYYRRPDLAPCYHRCGKSQPHAQDAPLYNSQTRLVAALNGVTGQVTYLQRNKIGKEALPVFYAMLRSAYPQAQTFYIAEDNWPVHQLPEVLQALEASGLTPLFFPTYASWLNPIEKLWRWLKQDVLHVHCWPAQVGALRAGVVQFLDQFALGSEPLLRYVDLMAD